MSSCISWCKSLEAEEASKDDDDACMLEDDNEDEEDEDEEDEDEEVSEDCSWAVADMSGRSRHEVRRGLWLRSMLAPHCNLAPALIYCWTTRGDKSDTRHSSCSWQFHGPSGTFDKVRNKVRILTTIHFGYVQVHVESLSHTLRRTKRWPRISFLVTKQETNFPAMLKSF